MWHEKPVQALCSSSVFHCNSVFILSCICSFLSFLLAQLFFFPFIVSAVCVCFCIRTSMGAASAEQQRLRRQPWYTLYSINSAHSEHFHTHTYKILCWQISTPPQPVHPDSLSSTSHPERMTVFPSGLVQESLCIAPPLRKHKEKTISFQLGSGEFSSCLHTLFEISLSSSTCGEHISFCFVCKELLLFYLSHLLCSHHVAPLSETNSPGKEEKVCLHSEVAAWFQLSSNV